MESDKQNEENMESMNMNVESCDLSTANMTGSDSTTPPLSDTDSMTTWPEYRPSTFRVMGPWIKQIVEHPNHENDFLSGTKYCFSPLCAMY